MTELEIIEELTKIHGENLKLLGKLRLQMQSKLNIRGHLRVYTRDKQFYYYLITRKGDSNGKYLPKGESEKIRNLCQRDYCISTIAALSKNSKAIHRFIKHYTPSPLETVWQQIHPGKQANTTPVQPTNTQFIAQWKSQTYQRKFFLPDAPELFTSSGVRVRSKSEIMIANLLEKFKVPYHYEKPLKISQSITFHPDFTCLNPRTMQEFIWEHFGLMDSSEYSSNAVEKISLYHSKGYISGKNLLLTFETLETPLNQIQVETLIKAFLQ